MKNFILFCLFTLFFSKTDAQNAKSSDEKVGELIALSFRLDTFHKAKLDSLELAAKASGNARVLAYIDFLQKVWKWCFVKITPEGKIQSEAAIDEITENSPFIDLRGHAFLWKGTHLMFGLQEYSKSLTLIFKGKKLLEEAHYERFPYVLDYYQKLFQVYYYYDDNKKAAYYCEQALKLPETQLNGHYMHYNNLGLCYFRMKEYDKAEQAFKASIEESKKHKNEPYEFLARGNIGNCYRLKEDYKSALPYLYADISRNEKGGIRESAESARKSVALCLLKLDSVKQAKPFLAPPKFTMPYWSTLSYDIKRFEALSLYHSKTGNFALAYLYKDSMMVLRDTQRARLDLKKLIVLESSLQAEKYINERKILESERQWRNVIIVCLVLLFSGVLYWFFQKRRHEKALEQEKRQRTEDMLTHANQQLTQYIANIKQKNDLIEHISQQLDGNIDLKLTDTEKNQHLQTIQNTVLLTETDWTEFKILFEQIFPNFFVQLSKDYPDLTQAEIRLLALEKLNLLDKEKGNMLGISADSVKKSRYRLRKKYPDLLDDK